MNTNETSLQVIGNNGILRKIINFFKKIGMQNNNMYFSNNVTDNKEENNNFRNSLKISEDPEKRMLLEIQKKIEKDGINPTNVYFLTKDLNNVQRKNLLELYQMQINNLNTNINDCRKRIINIRKNINA